MYVPNLGSASRVFRDKINVKLRRATTNGRFSVVHGSCVCWYTYCMNISGNGGLGSGITVQSVTAPLAEPTTCKHVNQHRMIFFLKISQLDMRRRALRTMRPHAKLEPTSAHTAVSLLAGSRLLMRSARDHTPCRLPAASLELWGGEEKSLSETLHVHSATAGISRPCRSSLMTACLLPGSGGSTSHSLPSHPVIIVLPRFRHHDVGAVQNRILRRAVQNPMLRCSFASTSAIVLEPQPGGPNIGPAKPLRPSGPTAITVSECPS
jgi:hypothetical protein